MCCGRAWLFTDVGTDSNDENIYSFTHASFREYFAAAHIIHSDPSSDKIADHIFSLAIHGQSEIYGQVCLNLYSLHSLSGASAVLADLISRIRRDFKYTDYLMVKVKSGARDTAKEEPLLEELSFKRATAVTYLAKASDCIPLTRDVAHQLVSLAVDQIGQKDVGAMSVLLDSTYKHRDAVLEAISDTIRDAIRNTGSIAGDRYIWFALNAGYLIHNVDGGLSLEAVNQLRALAAELRCMIGSRDANTGRSMIAVLSSTLPIAWMQDCGVEQFKDSFVWLFESRGRPIQALGPASICSWIFDSLGTDHRSVVPMAAVATLLRSVSRGLAVHGPVLEQPSPSGTDVMPSLHEVVRKILGRSCGYDDEFRLGLAYIVAAGLELMELSDGHGRQHGFVTM